MKNKLYLKIDNGQLSYRANNVVETDLYIALFECLDAAIDKKICDVIYASRHDPQGMGKIISGLYTMVLFDKSDKAVYMFADPFGYIVPLYYFYSDDCFVCSVSLRELLCDIKTEIYMNTNALPEFLYSGFICGKETLLQDVYKLPVLHWAIYSSGKIDLHSYSPSWYKAEEAESYEDLFVRAVLRCVHQVNSADITLSGGYDSNFILYALKRCGISVNAYTGGGIVGVDESTIAAQICALYQDTVLHITKVTSDTLQWYPHIVLQNEGALYERGIFMHYLLARQLGRDGVQCIISGDGADQVLSMNFAFTETEYQNVGKVPHNPWETNPFEMLSYIALKKTGCFLHQYAIKPQFPYLDRDFINHAIAVKNINGTNKDYHKAQLRNIISPQVYRLLNRNGGSTNLKPLFDGQESFEKYKRLVQASSFFSVLPLQPNRYGYEENEYDTVLKLLYVMIFEKLFVDKKYRNAAVEDLLDISIDKVLGV